MGVPENSTVSVVIPNWNGARFLLANVPAISAAVKTPGIESEIIVVDNGSTDSSVAFLQTHFPSVRIIQFEENKGFAVACNEGVAQAEYDKVLLLNNDAEVAPDFLAPLLEHFQDDGSLFAVSCRLLFSDTRRLNFGRTSAKFEYGVLTLDYLDDIFDSPCATLVASGAASLIDRQKFFELGGFDTDLFYYEDVDLSYRAWKRGWKILYEPASIVYHENQGTSSKVYTREQIDATIARSRFLFMWKNITDVWLLSSHLLKIPVVLVGALFLGKRFIYRGFKEACRNRSFALRKRSTEREMAKLSDKQVIALTKT